MGGGNGWEVIGREEGDFGWWASGRRRDRLEGSGWAEGDWREGLVREGFWMMRNREQREDRMGGVGRVQEIIEVRFW